MSTPPRRVRFQPGRVVVSGTPLPSVIPAPHGGGGSKSQAPAHGQGLGVGLAILSSGGKPGGGNQGGGPVPAFPHTSILDTFNRADSGSLGANWTRLNPGGALGYTSTEIGISGNAAYDPETAGANTASAAWTAATYAANQEVFYTLSVLTGNYVGVTLRGQNVNGLAVKYYLGTFSPGTGWNIQRQDSFSSSTVLTSGTTTTLTAGDLLGGRVYDAGGNVTIELWKVVSGAWTKIGSVTDSSASKITGSGNVGMVIGNPNGSSLARVDNFGGGAS